MLTDVAWGQSVAGCKTFRLHQGQLDILAHPARFSAAIAGTGGGKTVLGPIWAARQIKAAAERLKGHPQVGFVVAPTYPILARATAPTLVEMFRGTDLEGRYVPSQNLYYLPHDLGLIWLLGADRPGGLEGGQADWAWIDEGGQLKVDAWYAIRRRTGHKEAPILITTTPYRLNWLHDKFYQPFLAGDPDYYVRQWASIENPTYSRAEYESAKRAMSPQRAAMMYDGEFVRFAGLVYQNLPDCALPEHIDAGDYPNARKVGGIDWGWQNPFCALGAVLFVNEYGDDVLYVHYERYMRETGLEDHAASLPEGYEWWADPAEPSSIHEFRQAGHAVRKANNSIVLGIDAVHARLNTLRLVISPHCKALLAEAEQYAYPEKDDEMYGEKPLDVNNHAMDALRYLVMGVDRRRIARRDSLDDAAA